MLYSDAVTSLVTSFYYIILLLLVLYYYGGTQFFQDLMRLTVALIMPNCRLGVPYGNNIKTNFKQRVREILKWIPPVQDYGPVACSIECGYGFQDVTWKVYLYRLNGCGTLRVADYTFVGQQIRFVHRGQRFSPKPRVEPSERTRLKLVCCCICGPFCGCGIGGGGGPYRMLATVVELAAK